MLLGLSGLGDHRSPVPPLPFVVWQMDFDWYVDPAGPVPSSLSSSVAAQPACGAASATRKNTTRARKPAAAPRAQKAMPKAIVAAAKPSATRGAKRGATVAAKKPPAAKRGARVQLRVSKKTCAANKKRMEVIALHLDVPAQVPSGPVEPAAFGDVISFGSACTGMGMCKLAAIAAVQQRGATARFVFDSENDKVALRFLAGQDWTTVERRFLDCTSDEFFEDAPCVDVFLARLPWQGSLPGQLLFGIDDPRGRGLIIIHLLRYLRDRQPRTVLLENVHGLYTHHFETLQNIIQILRSFVDNVTNRTCYSVRWAVLNTRDIGMVPHNRIRVYILALKRCGRSHVPFDWPGPVAPVPLASLYDSDTRFLKSYENYPLPYGLGGDEIVLTRRVREALSEVMTLARSQGRDPTSYQVGVDAQSSQVNYQYNGIPCLTQARGKTLSHWKLQSGTFFSLTELCRLQGLSDQEIGQINLSAVTQNQLGGLLGNSFSKSVVQRILVRALRAAEQPV